MRLYQLMAHSERPMPVPKRRAVERLASAKLVNVEGLDGGSRAGV